MDIKKLLKKYIKENIEENRFLCKRKASFAGDYCALSEESINNYINDEKEENTFQTLLFKYIDKRLFSKIRSDKNYHPSKETIILLGISLELNEDEIETLLSSAAYSLPKNNEYDLIIRFCFKEKIYDLNQINEFLYDYNLKTLNN